MNILITGGASGLGAAFTTIFAKDQVNSVYFTYNKSEDNAKRIENEFRNSKGIKCDFKNKNEITTLTDNLAGFDIDVLINNAYDGNFLQAHFHKLNTADFLTSFEINVQPTIEITKAVITLFRKKKSGRIITILTSALLETSPIGASVYLANKAYLKELTKIWAVENARFNITSISVSPAFMLTNLTKDIDERIVDGIIEKNPLRRLLTVEEVAEVVLFLSTATTQFNGNDLPINAGIAIR